jgi:hypothetical protein
MLNQFDDDNANDGAGPLNVRHSFIYLKPTGLIAFSAFSFPETNDTNTIHSGFYTGTSAPQMNAWDVEAGLQRDFDFLGLSKFGETSFWGKAQSSQTRFPQTHLKGRPRAAFFSLAPGACNPRRESHSRTIHGCSLQALATKISLMNACRTAVVAWQAALYRSHNQTEHLFRAQLR